MADDYKKLVFLVLTMVGVISCYCPNYMQFKTGHCAFRIHCIGTTHGLKLPHECQGSTNYPVNVNLTLTEAVDEFVDDLIDINFLASVTILTASGNWTRTSLAFLEYMPSLKHLYLSHNHIKNISGSPFTSHSLLESVDLSHNKLTDIEDLFIFDPQSNNMRNLSLAYNALEEIPGDAFEELTSLIELDLSNNFITDLNEEPFINLTNLVTLRLNNNRIIDLNGAVNNLRNLKHLYLRGNQIRNIDMKSINIITHLELFDISGNQLEDLKPIIFMRHWQHFDSHSICKIILSENQIVSIPNATSKEISDRYSRQTLAKNEVIVLTELDLSNNVITDIKYNAFQSVTLLISLDLSHNKLIDFYVNKQNLIHVKHLNLSYNYITNLYRESFSAMTQLRNLDLSFNRLHYIPDQIFEYNYGLKYINLTYNDIKELDNLYIQTFHLYGSLLDLSNNGMTRLNVQHGQISRIEILILNSNNLSNTSNVNLIYAQELKRLDLSKNNIETLNENSLFLPVTMVYLDLSYNAIEKIGPSTFNRIAHLKYLNLKHNKLEKLEYGSFQGLVGLLDLDLSYNKIAFLDSKVLTDLKSLRRISLQFNGLNFLDYKAWLSHKDYLIVYLEGNNYTCDWLSTALNDFNNGYSKMRPAVSAATAAGHSLEGIPCIPEKVGAFKVLGSNGILADERLLLTVQKILEAVREQNSNLKKFLIRDWMKHQENKI